MASILAVDDSASMRQMVAFTLKGAGYDVTEAVDGQDALTKARSKQADVVLALGTRLNPYLRVPTGYFKCIRVRVPPLTWYTLRHKYS